MQDSLVKKITHKIIYFYIWLSYKIRHCLIVSAEKSRIKKESEKRLQIGDVQRILILAGICIVLYFMLWLMSRYETVTTIITVPLCAVAFINFVCWPFFALRSGLHSSSKYSIFLLLCSTLYPLIVVLLVVKIADKQLVLDTVWQVFLCYSLFVFLSMIVWSMSTLIVDKPVGKITNAYFGTIYTIVTVLINFILACLPSNFSLPGLTAKDIEVLVYLGYSTKGLLQIIINAFLLPVILNTAVAKLIIDLRQYYHKCGRLAFLTDF